MAVITEDGNLAILDWQNEKATKPEYKNLKLKEVDKFSYDLEKECYWIITRDVLCYIYRADEETAKPFLNENGEKVRESYYPMEMLSGLFRASLNFSNNFRYIILFSRDMKILILDLEQKTPNNSIKEK